MLHLPTFDELRQFVKQVLCNQADIELSTPMLETDLIRRGEPCGIEYTLLGPRSVRLSAIWETFQNRILFYDQQLERFRVSEVLGPEAAAIPLRQREVLAVKSLWKGK